MSDTGKIRRRVGSAWRGGWSTRLQQLLASRGFETVSAFADTRPGLDLVALARELGPDDVAAIQLQWAMIDEALSAGTLERCARDLLARRVASITGGWPGAATGRPYERTWPLIKTLSEWQSAFAKYENAATDQIVEDLISSEDIPAQWRPSGPDDPVLVDAFHRRWPSR